MSNDAANEPTPAYRPPLCDRAELVPPLVPCTATYASDGLVAISGAQEGIVRTLGHTYSSAMSALVDTARELARFKLEADLPRRWSHVQAVAAKARQVAAAAPAEDRDVLVTAPGCMTWATARSSSNGLSLARRRPLAEAWGRG